MPTYIPIFNKIKLIPYPKTELSESMNEILKVKIKGTE